MNSIFFQWLSFSVIVPLLHGYEWLDDDAIYIQKRPLVPVKDRGNTDLSQIPVEVIVGSCKKSSDCYPFLFNNDNKGPINRNLYSSILSTASYCERGDIPQDISRNEGNPDDAYIWCPIRSYSPNKPLEHQQDYENETNNPTTLAPVMECGPLQNPIEEDDEEDKAKLRVVGGTNATSGEFPWMVALIKSGKQYCSGTLIDDQHVLCAAHCLSHLKSKDLRSLKALIGDHDIKNLTETDHQERAVSAVIFHANFSVRSVHSDIGLVVLSKPVHFTEKVRPICLPSMTDDRYEDGSFYGLLTGWGQTGLYSSSSAILMKSQLRIWRHAECAEKYGDKIPGGISHKMICAGSIAPVLKDACKGDSGGPLSLVENERMEQIGIVSFGIGCGEYPGVFTKVSAYMDWIEKHRLRSLQYFIEK